MSQLRPTRRLLLRFTPAPVWRPCLLGGPRLARQGQGFWAERPLRIAASAPGSVTDIRARWLADKLAPALGQSILVRTALAPAIRHGPAHARHGYTL